MLQSLDPKVSEHYLCLFALSAQSIRRCLATLAIMVKLVEGDKMRKLCIEACGLLTYCMNIEGCMNVEVEIYQEPWHPDIKASI